MRKALLALLITWQLLTPALTQACSCGRISIEDAFRSSDAVFIGKVISIEPKVGTVHRWIIATYDNLTNKDIDDSLFDMEVKLEVTKLWKGGATKSLTIVTPDPDVCCICGFEFEVGRSYLVYADGSPLQPASAKEPNLSAMPMPQPKQPSWIDWLRTYAAESRDAITASFELL